MCCVVVHLVSHGVWCCGVACVYIYFVVSLVWSGVVVCRVVYTHLVEKQHGIGSDDRSRRKVHTLPHEVLPDTVCVCVRAQGAKRTLKKRKTKDRQTKHHTIIFSRRLKILSKIFLFHFLLQSPRLSLPPLFSLLLDLEMISLDPLRISIISLFHTVSSRGEAIGWNHCVTPLNVFKNA